VLPPPERVLTRRRRLLLWLLASLALLWFVGASVWATLPQGVVVIGAGPEGGTYAQHAHAYASKLQRMGLKTRIEHVGDSLRIVDRVNGPCHCLDVGFTAQALEPAQYPDVVSAGAIELQPLFLFVHRRVGDIESLSALQGRRVVMPLEHSASSEAARAVLAQYRVSTAPPRYLHIAEAAAALQRGEADAGFFMLSPDNALIAQLVADPSLRLFSFEQQLGLSRRIDHLQPALLARGAFSLADDLPPRDTRLLAASVNVVVRRDIHPVVLYALLGAMNELHRGQTLVSNHGDFPSTVRTALPVHEKAAAWAKNGTPWLYEKLPPWLASPVDEYWGMALFIVAVSSVFGTLGTVIAFVRSILDALRRAGQALGRWLLRRLAARPALGASERRLLGLADGLLADDDAASRELLAQTRARTETVAR